VNAETATKVLAPEVEVEVELEVVLPVAPPVVGDPPVVVVVVPAVVAAGAQGLSMGPAVKVAKERAPALEEELRRGEDAETRDAIPAKNCCPRLGLVTFTLKADAIEMPGVAQT